MASAEKPRGLQAHGTGDCTGELAHGTGGHVRPYSGCMSPRPMEAALNLPHGTRGPGLPQPERTGMPHAAGARNPRAEPAAQAGAAHGAAVGAGAGCVACCFAACCRAACWGTAAGVLLLG
eukprot:CAMPEP_0172195874 /NCGR_PEP_ID=MMETSP1050-20130122/26474_1 /TAXON_ID=233186 /ORGANISM="Cryptomonas curvata, Strain CCAP979/52" /LENGTH=120 /DNA_ID=CAMNT_0012872033 /DNA_START=78 /DNA_END=444 /DNA_ORIENTATION=-